jgi:hypothetical protein
MQKMNKFLFKEYGQCKERFWFRINELEPDIKPPDAMQEFFLEQIKLIEHYAHELLSKKNTISCELQKEIETDNFSVKIDICAKHLKSGKTDIYELYNSRGFKTHRLWDLAFLSLALKDAGYKPGKVFAVSINPDYVRTEGEIVPEDLLQITDLSQKVSRVLPKVKLKLKEAFERVKIPCKFGPLCNKGELCAYAHDIPEKTLSIFIPSSRSITSIPTLLLN